jgi:hypothetical protein
MLMTQDKHKVKQMWYAGAFLYWFILLLLVLIGLAAMLRDYQVGAEGPSQGLLCEVVQHVFEGRIVMINVVAFGFLAVLLSTMDSYLHAIGVSFSQDIMDPARRLLGYGSLAGDKKLKYARSSMIVAGVLALVLGFFGRSELENSGFYQFRVLLSGMIVIPLVIGILGVKTDRNAFIYFGVVFLVTNIGLRRWGMGLYGHFLMGIILGLLAFSVSHLIKNGKLVLLERSKHGIAERGPLWWRDLLHKLKDWYFSLLNLKELARRHELRYTMSSLNFSLFVFAFYAFSSIVTTGNDAYSHMAPLITVIRTIGLVLCAGLALGGLWTRSLRSYFAFSHGQYLP